jgi:Helicase associated domain
MGKREQTLDHKWEMQFFELKKFKDEYGHCDVPQRAKHYSKLANWCISQRQWKKFRPLEYDPDRVRKLDSIGFSWNVLDKWFEKHFIELEKYINTTGHSYVSSTDNKPLWKWCSHIREEKAKGLQRLIKNRIKRLDAIGFDWNPPENIYEDLYFAKRLNELKKFIEIFKRHPSSKDEKYAFLYNWVETQRNDKNNGILGKERIKQLNECGFIWDVHDNWWKKNFIELSHYKEKYGHCNVSNSKKDRKYKSLEFWSRRQRDLFKESNPSLTPDRIQKLNSIGFS